MLLIFSILICSLKPKLYHGREFSKVASIERNETSKNIRLNFTLSIPFQIYAGDKVDEIDYENPINLVQDLDGLYTIPSQPKTRKYFQIVTKEGKCIIADRHLPIEKGFNYRDLGGYPTRDGRHVKWGQLFRTDEIHDLTNDDKVYINSISIKNVIDFRTYDESNSNPEHVFTGYHHLPIEAGNLVPIAVSLCPSMSSVFGVPPPGPNDPTFSRQDVFNEMVNMNKLFINNDIIIGQYRKFFEQVQNSSAIPLIYHCSAGKDRTGAASLFILTALGVSEDVIIEDYLLSNKYLAPKYAGLLAQCPDLTPAFGVQVEFIRAAIDTAKEKYGSVENFLTQKLGVNIALMRERFLD